MSAELVPIPDPGGTLMNNDASLVVGSTTGSTDNTGAEKGMPLGGVTRSTMPGLTRDACAGSIPKRARRLPDPAIEATAVPGATRSPGADATLSTKPAVGARRVSAPLRAPRLARVALALSAAARAVSTSASLTSPSARSRCARA